MVVCLFVFKKSSILFLARSLGYLVSVSGHKSSIRYMGSISHNGL